MYTLKSKVGHFKGRGPTHLFGVNNIWYYPWVVPKLIIKIKFCQYICEIKFHNNFFSQISSFLRYSMKVHKIESFLTFYTQFVIFRYKKIEKVVLLP